MTGKLSPKLKRPARLVDISQAKQPIQVGPDVAEASQGRINHSFTGPLVAFEIVWKGIRSVSRLHGPRARCFGVGLKKGLRWRREITAAGKD